MWFAIRNVYVRDAEGEGRTSFYERHILWNATDVEAALAQSQAEEAKFLKLNAEFRRAGQTVAFEIGDTDNLHGVEVWSSLGETSIASEEFYAQRYDAFEYRPDE